jgi:hypothetical protein
MQYLDVRQQWSDNAGLLKMPTVDEVDLLTAVCV